MVYANKKIISLVLFSILLGFASNKMFFGEAEVSGCSVLKKDELKKEVVSLFSSKNIGEVENQEAFFKLILAYLGIKVENQQLKLLFRRGQVVKCREINLVGSKDLHKASSSEVEFSKKTDIEKKNTKSLMSFKLSNLKEMNSSRIWMTPMSERTPKQYLEGSNPFEQSHFLMDKIQGVVKGEIMLSNGAKLQMKIKSRLQFKNNFYKGTSYVEISNNQKSFLVSSNENGKSSNFRLGTNDEGPILIVKIRPSYFLRLQYNSISEYYSGHLYSLDPSNKFYKLIGEIIKLK
jgi:hypothetical protein